MSVSTTLRRERADVRLAKGSKALGDATSPAIIAACAGFSSDAHRGRLPSPQRAPVLDVDVEVAVEVVSPGVVVPADVAGL
jgi:hypothetical protein